MCLDMPPESNGVDRMDFSEPDDGKRIWRRHFNACRLLLTPYSQPILSTKRETLKRPAHPPRPESGLFRNLTLQEPIKTFHPTAISSQLFLPHCNTLFVTHVSMRVGPPVRSTAGPHRLICLESHLRVLGRQSIRPPCQPDGLE